MQRPERLETVLSLDSRLRGATDIAYSSLATFIGQSSLPFFPDYTDHGLTHIESVLQSSAALISDAAWEHVTPGDAHVLCTSVLIHDIAMHFTEETFTFLIDPSLEPPSVDVSDEPWTRLWERFMTEATRWDGRKLNRLFGSSDPIRRPPDDPINWTRRDRMLIGEFLRLNHPRIAHEVAISGIRTHSGILRVEGVPDELRPLVGLIARSHGLPMRWLIDALRNNFDHQEFREIHGTFLGCVIRVADYLQLQASRAPQELLKVKKLRSPLSSEEWDKHHAVEDIRTIHQDTEAIYVQAKPPDVKVYLGIRKLLDGLQLELDECWAALGETYGRFPPLSSLGLTIRRVRSNLDSEREFRSRINYIPRKATFETENADLLRLLIGPLYGNKPSVGVRELLQNSIDAVRERSFIETKYGIDIKSQCAQLDGFDITIELSYRNPRMLRITDSGVGMDEDIIINYFLKAGASYRRSSAWLLEFSDRQDGQVKRSGRFGIGALAGFLLGSKLKVLTRRYSEESSRAISFEADLDSDDINLTYTDGPVGTTIEIELTSEAYSKLVQSLERSSYYSSWQWYYMAFPSVGRFLLMDGQRVAVASHGPVIPEPTADPPSGWYSVSSAEYDSVLWTFQTSFGLSCNGIRIGSPEIKFDSYGQRLRRPNIAIFDSDGALPLTLTRDSLAEQRLPVMVPLMNEVMLEAISHSFATLPESNALTDLRWTGRVFGGFAHGKGDPLPFVLIDRGFVLASEALLSSLGVRVARLFWIEEPMVSMKDPQIVPGECIALCDWDPTVDCLRRILRLLSLRSGNSILDDKNRDYGNVFVERATSSVARCDQAFLQRSIRRLPDYIREGLSVVEHSFGGVVTAGEVPLDIDYVSSHAPEVPMQAAIRVEGLVSSNDKFVAEWIRLTGDGVLPHSMAARKSLPGWQELRSRIEKYS